MLVIEDDSSLLAPSSISKPECKETLVPMKRLESTAEADSIADIGWHNLFHISYHLLRNPRESRKKLG